MLLSHYLNGIFYAKKRRGGLSHVKGGGSACVSEKSSSMSSFPLLAHTMSQRSRESGTAQVTCAAASLPAECGHPCHILATSSEPIAITSCLLYPNPLQQLTHCNSFLPAVPDVSKAPCYDPCAASIWASQLGSPEISALLIETPTIIPKCTEGFDFQVSLNMRLAANMD